MEYPLVSVVTCSYNRRESLLAHNFAGLSQLTYPNFEVILVDDGSTEDMQPVIDTYRSHFGDRFKLIVNRPNQGLCASRNTGAQAAQGRYIVFTDDDVRLSANALNEVVSAYRKNPEVSGLWGCVYQHNSQKWHPDQPTFGTGSLMSFRREVFYTYKFKFDTNLRYFGTYMCDEHEFTRRLIRNGYTMINAEKVQVDHFRAPSKDRAWRGLSGDMNYLYEQAKQSPLWEYYGALAQGIKRVAEALWTGQPVATLEKGTRFIGMIKMPHLCLVLLKNRAYRTAAQLVIYTLFDIPFRAKLRGWQESRVQRSRHTATAEILTTENLIRKSRVSSAT